MKIQYYSFHEEEREQQEEYVYIMRTELLLWLQQHMLAVLHQQKLMLQSEGREQACDL